MRILSRRDSEARGIRTSKVQLRRQWTAGKFPKPFQLVPGGPLCWTEEEIASGDSLYGLFAPLELSSNWSGEVLDLHDLPHRIIIYKRPLEEDFPNRSELLDEIRKTVIHELAHHFGYTDRDLEKWTDVY